jgi:F0F1-type ATP synthase assembly protein I
MAKTDRDRPTWLRFSGIGVEFAGVVIGFTLIGLWIDRHYDKSPWGVVIGSTLGLVGGMYNLIRESLAASREAANEKHNAPKSNGGRRHEP